MVTEEQPKRAMAHKTPKELSNQLKWARAESATGFRTFMVR